MNRQRRKRIRQSILDCDTCRQRGCQRKSELARTKFILMFVTPVACDDYVPNNYKGLEGVL